MSTPFDLAFLVIMRWGIKRYMQTHMVDAETLEKVIAKAKEIQEWGIARAAEDELIRLHRLEEARR